MKAPTILLIDNGSRRAASTLQLRQLALQLEKTSAQTIYPVSLQHADHIDAEELGGITANTLEPFLRGQLQAGQREFLALPLFFGKSRALTSFIPETVNRLAEEFGSFELRQAAELCPLPGGEPLLAQILYDNIITVMESHALSSARVVLVDHGSPIPEVTAVREWLAKSLQQLLGQQIGFYEAVMERRAGSQYDFNGQLLEELLPELVSSAAKEAIILSMLFISPGRHAGAGGDIETIRDELLHEHPQARCYITPLVGEHPTIIEILRQRLEQSL